jgi:hypothetical protein
VLPYYLQVTLDVVFLTDMGISVSKCEGSEEMLCFILHLVNIDVLIFDFLMIACLKLV